MGVEIERKFLVHPSKWAKIQATLKGKQIQQGYLSLVPERTIRVRIKNDQGFLTIKGKNQGIQRQEFEYKIPMLEAQALLQLCEGSSIKKTRYSVLINQLEWEIDVFEGDNAGLIVAEVELPSIDTSISTPKWIAQEVSDDSRYYNANLVQHPFKDW